jgi:organic radical activating enzyme
MQQDIQSLIEKYSILPAFFMNYFHKNAFERYMNSVQEFIFWRRGKFLAPHRKNIFLHEFVKDEITTYYEHDIFRIPSVQFAVTTRCTLRCRDCSVMMPRIAHSGEHSAMTFAQFKEALDAVLTAVDSIGTVLLLGGEPLLNADLPEILACAADNDKVGLVDIVTNCTIVPSQDLIAAAVQYNKKVFFGLSNYSGNPELASRLKRTEIITILKKSGIRHTLDTGEAQWFRYDLQECSYSDEQMREIFAACQWHHCLYVLDGLLGICPRSLVGQKLGAFVLNEDEMLSLRGQNTTTLRNALKDFYKKDYLSACRWCLKHYNNVDAAIQEI